jgi:hypothetical protein
MLDNISCNLLLGRPRIHDLHVVPSTIHHIMKYVFNNKAYKIGIDPEAEI